MISYQIYQSGYFLDHVSAFVRKLRPSTFQGTWMAVVYWDAIHPYIGESSPEVGNSICICQLQTLLFNLLHRKIHFKQF